mmetsp:Transcript_30902/g.90332  ORF Transcript_30902/g.90332 Transcript_30902/m.90332 type:complete len:203 (-) Transcript_30902:3727-4335(-)
MYIHVDRLKIHSALSALLLGGFTIAIFVVLGFICNSTRAAVVRITRSTCSLTAVATTAITTSAPNCRSSSTIGWRIQATGLCQEESHPLFANIFTIELFNVHTVRQRSRNGIYDRMQSSRTMVMLMGAKTDLGLLFIAEFENTGHYFQHLHPFLSAPFDPVQQNIFHQGAIDHILLVRLQAMDRLIKRAAKVKILPLVLLHL